MKSARAKMSVRLCVLACSLSVWTPALAQVGQQFALSIWQTEIFRQTPFDTLVESGGLVEDAIMKPFIVVKNNQDIFDQETKEIILKSGSLLIGAIGRKEEVYCSWIRKKDIEKLEKIGSSICFDVDNGVSKRYFYIHSKQPFLLSQSASDYYVIDRVATEARFSVTDVNNYKDTWRLFTVLDVNSKKACLTQKMQMLDKIYIFRPKLCSPFKRNYASIRWSRDNWMYEVKKTDKDKIYSVSIIRGIFGRKLTAYGDDYSVFDLF